jgi:hypothetical protein
VAIVPAKMVWKWMKLHLKWVIGVQRPTTPSF